MATYVIEGTISELTKKNENNNSKISIKISGAEGYALKKKDNIFNVICQCTNANSKYVEDNKAPSHSLKIPEDFDLNISDTYAALCSLALATGRKTRIIFEEQENSSETDDETKISNQWYKIISLSLLAK